VDIQSIILVALVFLTFYNNGIQAYIHLEAYPLLAYVGKSEFATYIQEYERRINLVLVVPYGLTILANLALIFAHSDSVSLKGPILMLVSNLAVAAVTMLVATPVYTRIKQSGQAAGADMQQLMRINLIRLALSTLSSLTLIYILVLDLAIGHS
jgi:hypothetical protein